MNPKKISCDSGLEIKAKSVIICTGAKARWLGIESETPIYKLKEKNINAGWVTTFNEEAIVSENRVTKIPKSYDLRLAPLYGCSITTAFGVVNNDANIKIGQSVLIIGIGGVGLNIVQACSLVSANPIIGLDIHKNKLSSTMSSILYIDVSFFPKIITSNDISGYLKKDVAEQTGLKNTIPIVAGGADNACASLGAGVLNEGSLMLTVGTSGAVVAPSTKPEFDPLLRVHLMRHVSPKTWYKMGVILSAGGALDWWSKIFDSKNIQDLIEEIPDTPKNKDDILFLPYITGERTPYANPKARGVFFGLNAKTSRADLTYSVLQGIALALRDSLNLISTKNKINNAVLVGGGAKSKKWQKIIADTLQLNIMLIGQSEGASLGAAMLASCYSKEYFNSINEVASNWISVKDKIEPNHNESDYYSELHSRYSNLYNSIKSEYE